MNFPPLHSASVPTIVRNFVRFLNISSLFILLSNTSRPHNARSQTFPTYLEAPPPESILLLCLFFLCSSLTLGYTRDDEHVAPQFSFTLFFVAQFANDDFPSSTLGLEPRGDSRSISTVEEERNKKSLFLLSALSLRWRLMGESHSTGGSKEKKLVDKN